MPDSDPRAWPPASAADPASARLHALAQASLSAATAQESDRCDAEIGATLREWLDADQGAALAQAFETAPDAPAYRHLWRQLERAEAALHGDALCATVFALPFVIVAGLTGGQEADVVVPGVLNDTAALGALLREHGALSGNQTFALGNALVSGDAIDLPRLPRILRVRARAEVAAQPNDDLPDLPPAPMALSGPHETVHLRFVAGVALAGPGVDPVAPTDTGKWGIPMTHAVAAQLAAPGVSLLPLPHAPCRLVPALHTGRSLQREVSAQLFAGNAIRKLRAAVGEPAAVISAHRTADVRSGGELRLSLSSPFAERDAEGFRCPLYPADRIADVAQMLISLLRDCRVADVQVLPGVYADRDPATGAPLLFKPDALPVASLH